MTEYAHKHSGHDCPPEVDPADQPNQPPVDINSCLPPSNPPPLPDLPKIDECKKDPCCECPTTPGETSNCLENLITAENGDTGAAEKAKFKAELTKLLDTAKKASQDYTREKYDELIEKWVKLDADIAELVRKFECAVWCWKCILDCHVCPLLHELYYSEKKLRDDDQMPAIHDLYDQRYWLERQRLVREGTLSRIRAVLKAWEAPLTSIEKALNDNKKLLDTISPLIGAQSGKAIFDLFFRLIPLHLAVAPPATIKTTKIDRKFTDFCDCGEHDEDHCCGPEVGEGSFRDRFLPPQAYLIDPNDYFKVLCCLVTSRYKPATEAMIALELDVAKVKAEIDRYEKAVGPGWQAVFETSAKGAIPSAIDCCSYEKKKKDDDDDDDGDDNDNDDNNKESLLS
jgi:hypothetical protein